MTLRISIVVGNPKPRSRTLRVAETLVSKLFDAAPGTVDVIDLADYSGDILSWPNDRMNAVNERVAASDVAVFASPTYKATYTGLLKALLDRYPANGLSGLTAIPLLTGADLGHAMGPTVNLAPLLVELGALVPGRGFYFVVEHMDRLDEIVDEVAAEYAQNLRRLGRVAEALPASQVTSTMSIAR